MRPAFYSGGYFLTQAIARPEHVSSELLPSKLLTLSPCLAHFLPDSWAYTWASMSTDERMVALDALGVSREDLWRWANEMTVAFDAGDIGWPNVLQSFDIAADLFLRLPLEREWRLLGLGLHVDDVEDFMGTTGWTGSTPPGIVKALREETPIRMGGVALGFEVLGMENAWLHSWLCNGLESDAASRLAVRPNASGLIATLEDARRAARMFNDERLGESVHWMPWLVVDHTSQAMSMYTREPDRD
ncbi:MAG: hypothetical protein U0165_11785 [Polyangiaceae bacterium]